jgi:hypothetical protein
MCLCWLSCCIRLPWPKLSRPMLLPSASILLPYPSSLPARLLLSITACLACLSVRCSFSCLPSSRPGARFLSAFLDISVRLYLCLLPALSSRSAPVCFPLSGTPGLLVPHSSRNYFAYPLTPLAIPWFLTPLAMDQDAPHHFSFLSPSPSVCMCVSMYMHMCVTMYKQSWAHMETQRKLASGV